jgi:predicted RecA/RadA family phage recombinase
MSSSYDSVGNLIDHTPGSAVAAGQVVVIGSLVGVAPRPIAANTLGTVAVEGVYSVPKLPTGTEGAVTAGQRVYWYAVSGVAAVSHATGTSMGYAVAAAPAQTTSVRVKLDRG